MDIIDPSLYQLGFALGKLLLYAVGVAIVAAIVSLPVFYIVLYVSGLTVRLIADRGPHLFKYILIMFRSLQRNLLRTSLTYLATFVLVFVVTMILSVLDFLAQQTAEKTGNLKAIITEKFQNPSGMPRKMPGDVWAVASNLAEADRPKSLRIARIIREKKLTTAEAVMAGLPEDLRPRTLADAKAMLETKETDDLMTWGFVAATLDLEKRTLENQVFAFALEPRQLKTMMPGIDELTPEQMALLDAGIEKMEGKLNSIVVGIDRLRIMGKQVGDKVTLYGNNYKGVTFECEIVGTLPEGRWDQAAAMNIRYLEKKLDDFEATTGKAHEYAPKMVALVWLRLPTKEAFEHMAAIVGDPKTFNVAAKMEMESSAYSSFLDPFRDLFWALKTLLIPAILITMMLVIANAISISVRERRTEMAVLKVLGFRPNRIMMMILGEAILVGLLSSLISVGMAYGVFNIILGGISFPIAVFSKFFIPTKAFGWGLAMGVGTAFVGSVLPAWNARKVKASEVFSKVA